VVRVSMTDRDIVGRVAHLFERSLVTLKARRAHHRTPFAATLQGAPAVELMEAVYAFMGAKRQAEIQRAVLSWHKHRSRRRRPASPCGVDRCLLQASKRGLCRRHYNSWWKAHRRGRESSIRPIDLPSTFVVDAHACDERCDFSWLVGLLEGELTITTSRTRSHVYPVLKLEMTAQDVVTGAAAMLGSASVNEEDPEHEGWSITYSTSVSGSSAADWMRGLRGQLGRRRSEAIDIALAEYQPIRLVDPPATCVVPGCCEPHRGRGLCHKHYMMWSRDRAKRREARIVPLR